MAPKRPQITATARLFFPGNLHPSLTSNTMTMTYYRKRATDDGSKRF